MGRESRIGAEAENEDVDADDHTTWVMEADSSRRLGWRMTSDSCAPAWPLGGGAGIGNRRAGRKQSTSGADGRRLARDGRRRSQLEGRAECAGDGPDDSALDLSGMRGPGWVRAKPASLVSPATPPSPTRGSALRGSTVHQSTAILSPPHPDNSGPVSPVSSDAGTAEQSCPAPMTALGGDLRRGADGEEAAISSTSTPRTASETCHARRHHGLQSR